MYIRAKRGSYFALPQSSGPFAGVGFTHEDRVFIHDGDIVTDEKPGAVPVVPDEAEDLALARSRVEGEEVAPLQKSRDAVDAAVRARFVPNDYVIPYNYYYAPDASKFYNKVVDDAILTPEIMVKSTLVDALVTLGWRF